MDKIAKAHERLLLASEMSLTYYEQPLIICISGGKDSDVLLHLAETAGIPFETQHNHTTVDAPETVYHVREQMRRLEGNGIKCSINMPTYKGSPVTMWTLIKQKKFPPTRRIRYCCDILKEQGGKNRMISTGVRWAESTKRQNRAIYENITHDKNKRILANDNDDTRRLFEDCRLKAKRVCNPIIDWTDSDIWDYITSEHIQTNPLYAEDFDRVGCIGCPLATKTKRLREFARYPTYQRAYIRAFDKMIGRQKECGTYQAGQWTSGLAVYYWWMGDNTLPGQLKFKEMDKNG